MLTTIYEFWCKFIGGWTAIVPVSHSIDEETGDAAYSSYSSTSLSDLNNNKSNKKMIEPPPLEWRTFNQINEMPEPIIHQKDCYNNKNNSSSNDNNNITGNNAMASTDTDNSSSNLRTAKSPSCKSIDEKSEKSFN